MTRTYKSWQSMHQRCSNPKAPDYARYGGRGITVCGRWRSFEVFLTDMGPRPEGMTLDRKDVNRGYDRVNCRWTTNTEQSRNRRSTKLDFLSAVLIRQLALRGVPGVRLARSFGISQQTVCDVVKGRRWTEWPEGWTRL